MKYKREDFPAIESADEKEFEIFGTVLQSYSGERERIFVPYGITEINQYAFQKKEYDPYDEDDENRGSEYLEEVIFPDTVRKIGRQAFYACKYLKRVYIPESVTFISEEVFVGCCALEEIEADENNPAYKCVDGCLIDIEKRTLICGIAGCKIPAGMGINRIGRYAFNMRAVETVQIPEGVLKIDYAAFTGCSNLKEVILPKTLESIGVSAFSYCENLQSIILPESLSEICENAFGHSGIIEITFPESLKFVGKNAFRFSNLQSIKLSPDREYEHAMFENCTRLKKAEFLDGWKKIPTSFFKQSGIEEVILPDSVEEIGICAFGWCYSLKKITLPQGLKKICNKAFYCSGLEEVILPDNIEKVEYSAFGWCGKLKKVTVPPNVVETESNVFWRCERLESVVIEEGTKIIAKSSFSCCRRLNSVALPDSLEKIGGYAFGECTALKEIVVPKRTEIAGDAFYKCGVEPVDELVLLDMSMEEYKRLSSIKSNIKIERR